MTFRLICALATAAAVALVANLERAPAHPLSKPHASGIPALHLICKAVGKCKDAAPRPGPAQPCTPENDGAIEIVWDPRLEAYVTWSCNCSPQCHWRRLDITHSQGVPWDPPNRRHVIDAQRACNSIVCKKVWVGHWYPSQWVFGKRRLSAVEAVFGG